MAGVFQRVNYNVQETGQTVYVPNNPTAKLMYYLNCMCSVLELNDNNDIQRYRNYNNYQQMTNTDKNIIVRLCVLFDPRELMGKVIFPSNNLGGSSNKFLKIGQETITIGAVNNIVIGGRRQRVSMVMLFTMKWLEYYYINPLGEVIEELRRPARVFISAGESASCTIL